MKARRLIVTLEIESNESIKSVKEFEKWKAALEYVRGPTSTMLLHQVQANAIKKAKAKRR
jgi:hypothetical protein